MDAAVFHKKHTCVILDLGEEIHVEKADKTRATLGSTQMVHFSRGNHKNLAGQNVMRLVIDIHIVVILNRNDNLHGVVPVGQIIACLHVVPDTYGRVLREDTVLLLRNQNSVTEVSILLIKIEIEIFFLVFHTMSPNTYKTNI